MSIKDNVKSAAQWSLIEKFLKMGFAFVLSIFLARLLEPSDFGMVAMYSVFLSVASAFLDMGMGQALVQRKEVSHLQYNSIFLISLALGLFFYSVFWVTAPFISEFYDKEELTSIIRVASFSFIIHGLVIVHSSIIYKSLRLKVFTMAMVLSTLISGVVGITMAFNGYGVWSLVIHGLVNSIVNAIVVITHSSWRPNLDYNFRAVKDIWKSGLGFMNIGMINAIVDRLEYLVIGKYFSAADLGFMNRAKTLQEMPQMTVILPLTRPLFPYFSKIQYDLNEIQTVYLKSIELISFISLIFFGLIYLSAENIILILYTDKWIESVPYLKISVWLLPMLPISSVSTAVLKGIGRLKLLTGITLIERGVIIISLIVCVYYGLIFYLYALVILKGFVQIIWVALIRRYLKMDILYITKSFMSIFIISLISIRLVMFIDIVNPYMEVIINSLLYLILVITASVIFKVKGFMIAKNEVVSFYKQKKNNKNNGRP